MRVAVGSLFIAGLSHSMHNYHYSYFIGTLIFLLGWMVCYMSGKPHRAQMIWGSLTCGPLAISGFLFIPQYWSPPSLFDLDARFKIGIEDILWSAAVGGIASVIGEIVLSDRLSRIRRAQRRRHYAPFIVIGVVFVALHLARPEKTIYNAIASMLLGALVIAVLRSDLVWSILTGALTFTLLYIVLFAFFLTLYPEFIARFYNVKNLLGIYVAGIPLEEIMFAAGVGAIWSVAYEYVQGYRLESFLPPRLARVHAS